MIKLEWYIPPDASTPRGWLYARRMGVTHTFTDSNPRSRTYGNQKTVPALDEPGVTVVTLGYFLVSTAEYRDADAPYHAFSYITKRGKDCMTEQDALAFVEDEAKGKVVDYFAREFSGYEHEREAIRKLNVSDDVLRTP